MQGNATHIIDGLIERHRLDPVAQNVRKALGEALHHAVDTLSARREVDAANDRFNQQFNRTCLFQENNERLRTELDIVRGLIGCLSDEQRKAMNADWLLARINAALEITPE